MISKMNAFQKLSHEISLSLTLPENFEGEILVWSTFSYWLSSLSYLFDFPVLTSILSLDLENLSLHIKAVLLFEQRQYDKAVITPKSIKIKKERPIASY